MPEDGPFEKDFGYLFPFLERLKAHAGTLADPAAAERLAQLMDEEMTRWSEVRGILVNADREPRESERAGPETPPAAGKPRAPSGLTVGSLRRRAG